MLKLWFLLAAQLYTPGPQVVTFRSDVDDSDQPYVLYLPKSYDASRKYPLVIHLRGPSSNRAINLFQRLDFIVASPQGRGGGDYEGIAEQDVYDVLADVERRFTVDEDRVYLTGLSTGGRGALRLGLTRPDIWAAMALVCAATPSGVEGLTANASNIPVHLFHGDRDPAVPVESSRQWYRQFLAAGVKAEYIEYPAVRHNCWDKAYEGGAIYEWFAQFRRVHYPERVKFATRAYKYNSAYWVHMDSLTPGELASIDARFTADNKLEVNTSKLDGFTLRWAGHPRFSPRSAVLVTVDGAPLRLKPADTVSFVKTQKGWKPGRNEPAPSNKRPGLEGPLREAIASRHIYVYGTADAPGEEELKQRQAIAAHAADWSSTRNRLPLSFLVKADRDIGEKETAYANLVLFGTRETNRVVARFADRLGLALNAGAADYGLVFVAPMDRRYVVVNSGLPWWTGADQAKRLGFRFAPPPFRVLETFGDFILFKGSLESIVAEGLFDTNWRLPPEAAEKMKQTGVVVIQ